MADCNCNLELNKQIQGLSARLSQAEDNLTNHFYGISLAIQGLAANPLTAGSVASVTGIYNLLPTGFETLQNLISNVSPTDFKKYMMGMASGLLGNMEAQLTSMVSTAFSDISGMIDNVNGLIGTKEGQLTSAQAALDAAIAGGNPTEIANAQALVNTLTAQLGNLTGMKDNLTNALDSGVNFLTAQADIAKCKSFSLGLS